MLKRSTEHKRKDILGPHKFLFQDKKALWASEEVASICFTLMCFTLYSIYIVHGFLCVCMYVYLFSSSFGKGQASKK